MLDTIIHLTALIALFLAALQDLKTREVPDMLSYGLIAAAILLRAMAALGAGDAQIFLHGVYGLIFTIAFSLMMFYTGQWGGGDSKLLMGLGMLIGMPLQLENTLVAFIINIFFMGAIWGFIFTLSVVARNWNRFKERFRKSNKNYTAQKFIVLGGIIISAIGAVTTSFTILFLLLGAMIPLMFYLWVCTHIVEKHFMVKWYPVSKLTEGDWIYEPVKVDGKVVAGPKDLGITKKQIAELKKSKVKKVRVKEGIPFVPSFFLGYVALLFNVSIFALF